MQRLFRSSAFRLTLLYMALFSSSVAVLLVFIYLATSREMEDQIKQNINFQISELERKFREDGTSQTIDAIDNLIEKDTEHMSFYLLLRPNWEIVAGNLDKWPGGSTKTKDWVVFCPYLELEGDKDCPRAIGINAALPRGHILFVGYGLDNIDTIKDIITRVMLLCIGLAVVLAAAGGAFLTRNINRRLEGINQACRRVMGGEISHRAAVSGSGDEFDHLGENFNAMMARICELIDGVRDISSAVAHDLRTPLNRVRQRLEHVQASGSTREELNAAIGDIDELVATFNSILRISQAETGAGFEHFQPFDLSETATNITELYSALAEDKSISLHYAIAEGVTVNGDRHLLTQAMANLLDNAIKYTPAGGQITVELSAQDFYARLAIADSGPGIPPELHNKVTEKFFRMEASRTTPGSGLGLSLVNAAVKLHGGELYFEDNQPGLKAVILLPMAT